MDKTKALLSRAHICQYLEIGKNRFYALVKDGLPVRKRGGGWTGYPEELDEYFRYKGKKKHPAKTR